MLYWLPKLFKRQRCCRLKMYYINTLKQELSAANTYEYNWLDESHMTAKFAVFVEAFNVILVT